MEWVDGKKDGPCKKSAFFIETRDLHIPDVFRILFLYTYYLRALCLSITMSNEKGRGSDVLVVDK